MEIGVCEKGLLEYMRKSTPPPFLLKTYMLVEDPETDEIVSWNSEGTAFVVWQPAEFARDLLPTLFKHSNFSSFVRQLNTYGFRKVTTNRWEFCNDKFRKGEKDKLCEIRRRKAWSNNNNNNNNKNNSGGPGLTEAGPTQEYNDNHTPTPRPESSTSSSTSSGLSTLVDENKRLKRENGVLSSELSNMKSKCRELLDLVAKFSQNQEKEVEEEEDDEEELGQEVCDDIDEFDHRPKLFGVRLEVEEEIMKKKKNKRKRDEMVRSQTTRVLLSQACK